MRHAPDLVAAGALSVETVDSKDLNLAKKDPVWVSVSDYIKDVPGKETLGVNIVEFQVLMRKKRKRNWQDYTLMCYRNPRPFRAAFRGSDNRDR